MPNQHSNNIAGYTASLRIFPGTFPGSGWVKGVGVRTWLLMVSQSALGVARFWAAVFQVSQSPTCTINNIGSLKKTFNTNMQPQENPTRVLLGLHDNSTEGFLLKKLYCDICSLMHMSKLHMFGDCDIIIMIIMIGAREPPVDKEQKKWNESGFRPPLCTYRLNWARRTSWGWWDDWDDTVLQTQDSKFEPWRSEAEHATSRSRRPPHNTDFHTWMGKKHFCFFQTAETGNRTSNSGVKGSGANHYPRAPMRKVKNYPNFSNGNDRKLGHHKMFSGMGPMGSRRGKSQRYFY